MGGAGVVIGTRQPFVDRLGLTNAGGGIADADSALIVEVGAVDIRRGAHARRARIAFRAEVLVVASLAFVYGRSLAITGVRIARSDVALIIQAGAFHGCPRADPHRTGVVLGAGHSVVARAGPNAPW